METTKSIVKQGFMRCALLEARGCTRRIVAIKRNRIGWQRDIPTLLQLDHEREERSRHMRLARLASSEAIDRAAIAKATGASA